MKLKLKIRHLGHSFYNFHVFLRPLMTNWFPETSMRFFVTIYIVGINDLRMIASFSVSSIVMDNMAGPPFSCKKENSMTCRIDRNALNLIVGLIPWNVNGLLEWMAGNARTGREFETSNLWSLFIKDHHHFTSKFCSQDPFMCMTIKEKILGRSLF